VVESGRSGDGKVLRICEGREECRERERERERESVACDETGAGR
jgi:hypothetical protein